MDVFFNLTEEIVKIQGTYIFSNEIYIDELEEDEIERMLNGKV